MPPLRDVITGRAGPQPLFDRLEAQRDRALNRGEIGRYLVTFVDNHDSFWQPTAASPHGATDEQVIAAIGYLLCALGTPCIYYGTEQGFAGHGGDNAIREAMFDTSHAGPEPPQHRLQDLQGDRARSRRSCGPRRRCDSAGCTSARSPATAMHFGLPFGTGYTLAFSRILYGREVLVAYNVSGTNPHDFFVIVDADIQKKTSRRSRSLYGKAGTEPVLKPASSGDPTRFVRLKLKPMQFVILRIRLCQRNRGASCRIARRRSAWGSTRPRDKPSARSVGAAC